jgi:hypothetical protein
VRLYLMTTIICLLTNLTISILLSAFAMWDYNRINTRKEEQCREGEITEDRNDEFRNMGDHSPLFRYAL